MSAASPTASKVDVEVTSALADAARCDGYALLLKASEKDERARAFLEEVHAAARGFLAVGRVGSVTEWCALSEVDRGALLAVAIAMGRTGR